MLHLAVEVLNAAPRGVYLTGHKHGVVSVEQVSNSTRDFCASCSLVLASPSEREFRWQKFVSLGKFSLRRLEERVFLLGLRRKLGLYHLVVCVCRYWSRGAEAVQ